MQIDSNPPPRNGMNVTVHVVVVMVNILIVFLVMYLIGTLWKRGYLRSKSQMERGTHKDYYISYNNPKTFCLVCAFSIMVCFSQISRVWIFRLVLSH